MSVASVGFQISPRLPETLQSDFRQAIGQSNVTQIKKEEKPQIQSATADLQKIGLVFNKKLQFEVDHQNNQVIVKVIDKDTDKVIKELPPEELQRLHRNLKEAIGLLFDEMV